jgi:hypothetical protein
MNGHRSLLPLLAAISCGLACCKAVEAHEWFAREPPLLSLSMGVSQILDSPQEPHWGAEYRPAYRFFHFGPWLFFGTGKNEEFYMAVGVLLNLELGRGWVLTPSFGGGYYNAEDGLDLGFDAEFRSGIELARRFRNGHRLGIAFSHLSNGALSERNPGTETFGLVYSFPLDALFHHRAATASPEE